MAIITLTSDWGTTDYYVASVKGRILSLMPDATIVDISHTIAPRDIDTAAFIVRNCFRDFPDGTVHILAMDTVERKLKNSVNRENVFYSHIVVKAHNQYFIGNDNGIFSKILDDSFEDIVDLDVPQDSNYFTFCTRDRFVKAAVYLAKGGDIYDLGAERDGFIKSILMKPLIFPNMIKGTIVYVDNFGNGISNIPNKLFLQHKQGRTYKLECNSYEITDIKTSYFDVDDDTDLLALFGSHGFIELAICYDNADQLCGIRKDTTVIISFYDK
ncbi:MAG: SAM-dependent chlorinase/fluorinase [Lentimicrobiaceae bacterium]|jgi:S-adenosylmethionine hydrolase|nr:SAM-dependent chlorinase/fluorinase [Lentimicrobiaceae bacterium]